MLEWTITLLYIDTLFMPLLEKEFVEAKLKTKMFSTLNLKELQCPKSRLRQRLLGAIPILSFMQIRCTAMEK